MILSLAPKYPQKEIYTLYSKIDTNKNGLLQKEEILNFFGGGLIDQKQYEGVEHERALRTLKTLKSHLKVRGTTTEGMVAMGDKNFDDHIDEK